MEYTKNTFSLNQKVIVLNYQDLIRRKRFVIYDGVVTKVGRKFLHVTIPGQSTIQFLIQSGRDNSTGKLRYIVFPNRNAYADYVNWYQLRNDVKKQFNKTCDYLSVKQLQRIADVIGVKIDENH